MKRQWGFDHIMTKKTLLHASSDVGFMFIAYNLKRLFNTIGLKTLKAYFKAVLGFINITYDDIVSIKAQKQYLCKPQRFLTQHIFFQQKKEVFTEFYIFNLAA